MSVLLQAIQASLVEALSPSRTPERIGGFLYLRHPSNTLKWLNQSVAVAACDRADAKALLERYLATGRTPWLELFPAICPDAIDAIESIGLRRIGEAPIMAMTSAEWRRVDFTGVARSANREDVVVGSRVAAEAFGSFEPLDAEDTWRSVASGRLLFSVALDGDSVVAAGQAVGTSAIREIVGIGTLPDKRRRGFASAVIHCLLNQHFGSGGELAWLTPGDDGPEDLYGKLGFRTIGVQASYGLPD